MQRLILTTAPATATSQCRIWCELEDVKGTPLSVSAMLSGKLKQDFLALFAADQQSALWQGPWDALSHAQRSCVRKVNMSAAGWHCRLLPALTCAALRVIKQSLDTKCARAHAIPAAMTSRQHSDKARPCSHCALDEAIAKCAPDAPESAAAGSSTTAATSRGCAVNFNADGTLWACVPPARLLITCAVTDACARDLLQMVHHEWGAHASALVPATAVRVHAPTEQVRRVFVCWLCCPGCSVFFQMETPFQGQFQGHLRGKLQTHRHRRDVWKAQRCLLPRVGCRGLVQRVTTVSAGRVQPASATSHHSSARTF